MKENEIRNINTTALAYMGDAVYEMIIRKHILETGQANADRLHQIAVRFVRAESQAMALKALSEKLTSEEEALTRRARNRKITSKPRNVDPVTYKLATAFEALVGYLYLMEDHKRLQWFVEQSIILINNSGVEHVKR